MPTDYFSQLFPAACAGVGLFLAGAANLLLKGRRLRVRVAATLASAAVSLVCAVALAQPGVLAGTGCYLAVGLLAFGLLASRRAVGGAAAAVVCLHRPPVRYALLLAAGVGLLLGALLKFERDDRAAQEAGMAELEWLDRAPTVPTKRVSATTDRGTQVVMKEPTTSRDGVDWKAAEERTLKSTRLDGQVICRGGATEQSNCHGWVFTGGKFNISADGVELILKENGYQETNEPQPGDLAIYRQAGAISHTAVVRYVTEGLPVIVEGKWGSLGVFLHPADKCVYGTDYTFYRSDRQGHLLAGLGGSAPPATQAQPAVAE